MDIDTLKLFVSACELGNLSRVARRENVSPPTVTRRIQQLEKELGRPLIKRVHRGIAPTPEGRVLMEKSASLLAHLNNLHAAMPHHRSGTVTVMGSYSMTAGQLLNDIERFLALEENKNVSINLKESDKQTIADELRAGNAELGIFWNATDTSGLQLTPYRQDRAAAVVHKSHPLAQLDAVSFEEAVKYETVRTKTTHMVELMLERTGSISKIPQKNRVEVPTFEALLRLVKNGRYVGICPEEIAAPFVDFYALKIIPLSDRWACRNHVIACSDSLTLPAAAAALLEHLKACCRADASPNRA